MNIKKTLLMSLGIVKIVLICYAISLLLPLVATALGMFAIALLIFEKEEE